MKKNWLQRPEYAYGTDSWAGLCEQSSGPQVKGGVASLKLQCCKSTIDYGTAQWSLCLVKTNDCLPPFHGLGLWDCHDNGTDGTFMVYLPSPWQFLSQKFPTSGGVSLHLKNINSFFKNNCSMNLSVPHIFHIPYIFLYTPIFFHPCKCLPFTTCCVKEFHSSCSV